MHSGRLVGRFEEAVVGSTEAGRNAVHTMRSPASLTHLTCVVDQAIGRAREKSPSANWQV